MFKLSSLFLLIWLLSVIGVQKCHGVINLQLQDNMIVSALTPFNYNGDLNDAVISQLAQYYNDKMFKVVFVSGYYGEAASIPLPDRKRLVKAWVEQAKKYGFDLIVEVGALPFVDTLELASFCRKLNVTAIAAFAEVVYQVTTTAETNEDLQRICDASSNLPLVYHELTVVGQDIRTDQVFLGAMGERVSCFCGVITSINTFLDIKASVDTIAGYQLWAYGIEAISTAYEVGMNASGTVNLFPDLARRIRDAVYKCQLRHAAELQQILNRRMYAITNVYGGTLDPTSRPFFKQEKAAFELLTGIHVGYRYPVEKPNSTVYNKMKSNLKRLGVRLYTSVDKN